MAFEAASGKKVAPSHYQHNFQRQGFRLCYLQIAWYTLCSLYRLWEAPIKMQLCKFWRINLSDSNRLIWTNVNKFIRLFSLFFIHQYSVLIDTNETVKDRQQWREKLKCTRNRQIIGTYRSMAEIKVRVQIIKNSWNEMKKINGINRMHIFWLFIFYFYRLINIYRGGEARKRKPRKYWML